MAKATIIGNTTWGNTLAALLSSKGMEVEVWARSEVEAEELNSKAHRYSSTSNIGKALERSDIVIWVVPSQKMRRNVALARDYLTSSMLLVSAAKGLEIDSGKRMSQVITDEVTPDLRRRICVLSGPNLAREIKRGLPAASMVAAQDMLVAERARELMNSPVFLLFSTSDVVGVELGGALKNIVALGAGMIDGLSLGDNAKAAFVAWSWAEVVSLGVALGAEASTFYGLAGLGDLMATCASTLSRNHYVGYELARGRTLQEITVTMAQVAEGVNTAMAVHKMIRKLDLRIPIISLIYRVLFENLSATEALADFSKLISPDTSA